MSFSLKYVSYKFFRDRLNVIEAKSYIIHTDANINNFESLLKTIN
jgi:hypothetical protein